MFVGHSYSSSLPSILTFQVQRNARLNQMSCFLQKSKSAKEVQKCIRKRRVSHRRRERDATRYRHFRDAHPYTSSSPIHFVRAKRGRIPTYRDRVITREQPSSYVESTDTNTQILSFTLYDTGFDSLKRKWMALTESIIPAGQIITLHSPLGT